MNDNSQTSDDEFKCLADFQIGNDKAQCELLVDSGSDVSAIQWEFFQSHFKGVKLKKDPPALQNYDKTSNK